MEVITIETQAFKDLMKKIDAIAKSVAAPQSKAEGEPEDGWVDNREVCAFLKVCGKTLQRLRAANAVTYTLIGGKVFYRISEIQRLMNDNLIRRRDEHLQNLIKNYRQHVEQRRTLRKNK
jgi:hypothetical protein